MKNSNDTVHTLAAYLEQQEMPALSIIEKAIILQSICAHPALRELRATLAKNLDSICSDDWLQTAPLAEICAVLTALRAHDPSLATGERLALTVTRLLQAEQQPGGPYLQSNAPDILTNVTIAAFAQWAAGPLPLTIAFVRSHLGTQNTWPDDVMFYAHQVPELRSLTANVPEGSVPKTLTPIRAAHELWQALQPHAQGKLRLYAAYNDKIFDAVYQRTQQFGEPLTSQAATIIAAIERANVDYEISLLPRFFYDAMRVKPQNTTTELGIANIYCWLAYMVYDRILDDNDSQTMLPLANIAQRRALAHYRRVDQSPQANTLIAHVFDRMDKANAWEASHAWAAVQSDAIHIETLPDYGNGLQLAAKSGGHVLGPILLALSVGFGVASQELQHLKQAFWHFLIARQLNDDMHDWQEDFAHGQLSLVVTAVLHDAQLSGGTYAFADVLPQLQQLFRDRTAVRIVRKIEQHCALSVEHLRKSSMITEQNEVTALCEKMAATARKAIELKQHGDAFANRLSPFLADG